MDLGAINEPSLPIEGDQRAKKELTEFFSEHRRKERVKNTLNWIFIGFIIVTAFIAISVISIRLIHLVLPANKQWLTNDQVQGIDKLFFSGAIGGFLASYFKKSNEK